MKQQKNDELEKLAKAIKCLFVYIAEDHKTVIIATDKELPIPEGWRAGKDLISIRGRVYVKANGEAFTEEELAILR